MTGDPTRWTIAAVVIGLWLALVAVTVWRGVARARTARARAAAEPAQGADDILVAYASQTGFAEQLAEMSARALRDAGCGAVLRDVAALEVARVGAVRRALFIVSTTGEGDPPDAAARLLRSMREAADLSGLSYAVLALGDRTYRDYCAFGHALDGWLRRSGATPLFDLVEVDDADPEAIRHWQHQLNQISGGTAAPDWTPAAFERWRLIERRLLNPGSPGGEAWSLTLQPIDNVADWKAGDIAEVGPPGRPDEPPPGAREYSIASLPSDGGVELLVRLMQRPDGQPGLASGWLTKDLAIGDEVPLRLRRNSAFHGPDPSTPLILIGNGTGLAGLMAHIRARPAAETWLMFGERTRAHDAFHDDRLQAWLADGHLTRLDRAFTRDAGDGRYVQALIEEAAADVADWVARGAAVYVCGSLEGMASGVHAALVDVLGEARLTELAETGCYRRDVY